MRLLSTGLDAYDYLTAAEAEALANAPVVPATSLRAG